MSSIENDIMVRVGGDVSDLKRAMAAGSSSVGEFSKSTDRSGAVVVASMTRIATAAVAAGAAIGGLVLNASNYAEQVTIQAQLANASVEEFQKWAYAAETVGIQQDKLADILKDVNDRVGDFLSTGGGPMADFFETIAPLVGVTADEFARLSGPEALQLYVRSLEEAGVNSQQMTFYMEAMASDASAMLPLLRAGGQEIKRLGEEAGRAGAVIDSALIGRGVEIAEKWRQLMQTMAGYTKQFALQAATAIDNAFGFTDSGKMEMLRGQMDDLSSERSEILDQIDFENERGARSLIGIADTEIGRLEATLTAVEDEMNVINDGLLRLTETKTEREERLAALLDGSTEIGGGDLPAPGTAPGLDDENEGGGGGGGAGSVPGLTEADFEALTDRLAERRELLQNDYEERQRQLEEFLQQGVITEEQYNATLRELHEKLAADMAEIDRRERASRLSAMSGAFGDLSSLMDSENKKLFQAGKAASIASATVKGYEAAVSAWEKGMKIGGPGMAAAFTAASLAKTGALIASIQSTQSSGSSGGGSSGGGGSSSVSTEASGEATNSTYYTVNLQGEGGISRASVRALLEAINDEVVDGATIAGVSVWG